MTTAVDHARLIVSGGVESGRIEVAEGPDGGDVYSTIPGSRVALVPWLPQDGFLASIDALLPALLASVDLAARRMASRGVRNGHSPALAAQLEILIGYDLPEVGYEPEQSDTPDAGAARMEGALARVLSSRYERDRIARSRCIEHYGAECIVCGFSFERTYGDIGAGFIHVHHLVPLSETGGEYHVDPIRDLRPVCPNCHAMLHRGEVPVSIESLRARLTRPA